jgi:RNA polymerase sigma-70 factor (sigma-E family)
MGVVMRTGADTHDGATTSSRLEELYVRHAPGALRFAYYLAGDPEQARDLVQDAFVRVAGRFTHLRTPDVFETYLRRTILNLHTSRLRRLRLERAYLAREASRPVPDAVVPDPTERDEVWQAILQLPARQRAAVVLRFYEDLSEHQSAEILGCSARALNQLVVRATATLRERLGRDG